jgi:hypothetical protein
MPMAKLDLLLGYALAFGRWPSCRPCASAASPLAAGTGRPRAGRALCSSPCSTPCSGRSAARERLRRHEFQAVQFLPAVVLPQVLLCGLISPREDMAEALQWISNVLPLTYAVDAMQEVTAFVDTTPTYTVDALVVAGCVLAALGLGAATLRRRTA